jgi:hypothetical protein
MRALLLSLLTCTACTSHLHEDLEAFETPDHRAGPQLPDERPRPPGASFDGLELSLSFDGNRKLQPGQYFEPTWTLLNVAEGPRNYVMPGDGSGVGWREPHVYYTAQRLDPEGNWHEVEKGELGRCGLYDHDWHDEIHTLDSGETVVLEWLPSPAWQLQLQQAGRVRLFAHYEFSAGVGFGGERGKSEDLDDMADVPAFHLVSAPLELEVVRPLDLQLLPKHDRDKVRKLSDAFDLQLTNHGATKREVPAPDWMNVSVRVRKDGEVVGSLQDPQWESRKEGRRLALRSGQSLNLLGTQADFDLSTDYQGPGYEINVIYDLGGSEAGRLESGWTPVVE